MKMGCFVKPDFAAMIEWKGGLGADISCCGLDGKFPIVVEMVLSTKKPNLLCDYLFDCANKFNRFYNQNSVLRAESDELQASRLALVEAFLCIQKKGMELLGVVALDKM